MNGNASSRIKTIEFLRGDHTSIVYIYTYDKVGNITDISVENDSSVVENYHYEYDALNQLERENVYIDGVTSYTRVFSYDANGNIKCKSTYSYQSGTPTKDLVNPTTIDYNYENAWQDQLTHYGNEKITYDSSGNPKTIGLTITLKWEGGSVKLFV